MIYTAELVCANLHMFAGVAGEYENDAAAKELMPILRAAIANAGEQVPSRCPRCGLEAKSIIVAQTTYASVEEFHASALKGGLNATVFPRAALKARNN